MDILFLGAPRLERWDGRAFHPMNATARDRHDVYQRELEPEAPGDPGVRFRRVAAAIRAYSIFPPGLVAGVVRRPVEVGDTVGIHYRGLPLIRLFFAARVVSTFDEVDGGWWRAGFKYRTLVGHRATGRVRVVLRSWSRPGTWLARVFAPLVRRLQVHASKRALDHLAR